MAELSRAQQRILLRALKAKGRVLQQHRVAVNRLRDHGLVEWRNEGWQLTGLGWIEAQQIESMEAS